MIDILVGLAIGGAAGAVTSAPFAVKYVRSSLSSKKDVIKSVLSIQQENLRSFAELSNIKVKCLGIDEYSSESNESSIIFEFNALPRAVAQTGVGIVGAQAEWVHQSNEKKKKTTPLVLKDRIFLLEKDEPRKIGIPISPENNYELSSVQLNIYEGGVSKTHKIRLAVGSQIFSTSDI